MCLPCLSIQIKHYKLKLGFSLQRFCKTKRMECRKSIIFCTQQRPKKRIVSSKRLLEVFHKICQFTNPAHYAKCKNQDCNINIHWSFSEAKNLRSLHSFFYPFPSSPWVNWVNISPFHRIYPKKIFYDNKKYNTILLMCTCLYFILVFY